MVALGHGEKLTRRQEQAIAALLEHATLEAAAHAVGVGKNTLWRWNKSPAFQARFQEARARLLDSTVDRLQNASGEAVEALRRALSSGNTVAEIKAAQILLEQLFKTVEVRLDAGVALKDMLAVPPVKTVLYTGDEGGDFPVY
jgi:hypothetical protein